LWNFCIISHSSYERFGWLWPAIKSLIQSLQGQSLIILSRGCQSKTARIIMQTSQSWWFGTLPRSNITLVCCRLIVPLDAPSPRHSFGSNFNNLPRDTMATSVKIAEDARGESLVESCFDCHDLPWYRRYHVDGSFISRNSRLSVRQDIPRTPSSETTDRRVQPS
jgi:hypothetical protein